METAPFFSLQTFWQMTFNCQQGSYRFRADLNGTQFWSGSANTCSLPGCASDAVTVTQPLTLTVQDASGTPEAGVSVYAFDGPTYTGYSGTSDANGQVVFTLPQGSYRFRADLDGTQFWSSADNTCTLPGCTAADITVTTPMTVTVKDSAGTAKAGLPVYAFNGTSYTGYNGTTDTNGQVLLTLPQGDYRFRADLNGTQFWTSADNACSLPGCLSADITVTEPLTVTVQDTDGTAKAGLPVYAFTLTGTGTDTTYTGYNSTTDASGQVAFALPQGSYRFRVDLNGTQFWSSADSTCDLPGCTAAAITVSKPVTVTVASQTGQPYAGLQVYAFDGTTYTGFNGTTDAHGQVSFTLPQGDYRFRADYNGVQFWSGDENSCTLPGCTVAGVTLPGGQSAATNVTINYTYDPLYRLTAADYSDGKYFHYAYDAVGNRLIQDANPSGQPASTSYTYDSANRLTSVGGVTYTWDANGNLKNDGTNAYTYDSANRLTAVNGGQNAISYKYDGLGNRLQQTANGTTITYMNDLNVGLTQVLSDGTNTYLYGNDRIAQSPITNSQSTIQYFLGDALGSVRQMVDESGAVVYTASYDPYGEVLSTAGEAQTSYGYSGEETDSYIKLIDLRSRMYSPETGRFLTQDTWQGDYERPQSLNEWDYTSNNPINNIDPTGHCIGPNGVNLPDGSTACASTTATVYPPVFYRGYSQDKLLSYWQTQEPGYPTGCGPFAIAIAANLYNSSYKGSNYKGADIEAFLEETGSKIRGLGMPSWLNFGGSLGYYAHGWVDYKSNASVEDLELAIENNKLPVVAVSWQSSDTINKLFWQDMCPNGKFNIFHKPDFGNITVGHYMVAVGFDPQKDQIIFLDPGIRVKQLHYYSYQEFNNDWNGTSNQFIQVGSMWTIFP